MVRPDFSTEQLNVHYISGIETFDVGWHIDQTVCLHHGSENAGPLIPGRPHLEHTVFLRKDPTKKVTPVRTFREFFLEHRLYQWTAVTPAPSHLQHGRTHELFERDH